MHRNSAAEARALAAELGNAAIVAAELAEPDAAATVMAALDGLPPPRLLVNNASRFVYDSAEGFTVDQWDLNHAINLRAAGLAVAGLRGPCRERAR